MGVLAKMANDGNHLTVCVDGRFDFGLYEDFRHAYESVAPSGTNFSVDLTRASYMDSSALGMLLLLKEYVGDSKSVDILNPSEEVKSVLKIANFDKLFNLR